MAIGALAEVPIARKPLRQLGDAVAVAHPDRIALADLPDAFGERRRLRHLDLGAAEFAVMAGLDLAAELLRHGLLAVADAEHRHAGLVDRHRRERRVLVEHGGRPAGEDHPFRLHLAQRGFRLLERHDLAIDPLLAHAPRDELGHLRAEIDDENLVVGGIAEVPWRICPSLPPPQRGRPRRGPVELLQQQFMPSAAAG